MDYVYHFSSSPYQNQSFFQDHPPIWTALIGNCNKPNTSSELLNSLAETPSSWHRCYPLLKKPPVFQKYLTPPVQNKDTQQSSTGEDPPNNGCSKGVRAKRFERGALTVLSWRFVIDAIDKQEVFSCVDRFWNLRELDVAFKPSSRLTPMNLLELLTFGLKVDGNENQYRQFKLAHTLESFRMDALESIVTWDSFYLFLRSFPRLGRVALGNILLAESGPVQPLSSSSPESYSQLLNISSFSYHNPIPPTLSALLTKTFPNLKELSVHDLSDIWRCDSTGMDVPSTLIPFQHLERLHSLEVCYPPPRQGLVVDYGAQDSWTWSNFPPGLLDLEMESNDNNSVLVRRWMQQLTQQLEKSSVRLRSLKLGETFELGEILLSSTVCHGLQHLEILTKGCSVL